MLPDVGMSEILVIALVAALVMKPEDIPVVMRRLGIWVAHLQRFIHGIWAGWKEQSGI